MGHATAPQAAGSCAPRSSTHAGVTRTELSCGPQTAETAARLARQWGQDRVIGPAAVDRLVNVVLAAVANGLRFGPARVTLTLQWLDLHRVRVDAEWTGCSQAAPSLATGYDVESTVATLEAFAETWGFESARSGPIQWMVLDIH